MHSTSKNGAAHEIDVFTSGFGEGVFWQIIGTLEMLVYNLKSIGNFVN